MGPKQKMSSITHNSSEVNAPKKGIWNRWKSSSTSGAAASGQMDKRQVRNVALNSSHPRSQDVNQSLTSGGANYYGEEKINDLQRQHMMKQRHYKMQQQQQAQEQMTRQQQKEQYNSSRSDSYAKTGSREGYQRTQSEQSQHQQKYHRRNSTSNSNASTALANLSMTDQQRTSDMTRGSRSPASRPRRRTTLSEDVRAYHGAYEPANSRGGGQHHSRSSTRSSWSVPSNQYNVPQASMATQLRYTEGSTDDNGRRYSGEKVVDDSTLYTVPTSHHGGSNTMPSSRGDRHVQNSYSNEAYTGEYYEEYYEGNGYDEHGCDDNGYVEHGYDGNCYEEHGYADEGYVEGATDYVDESVDTFPTGEVTIVYADVQGASSLWEACPDDMTEAQDIYDIIMRRCLDQFNGYEISSTGLSFNLAFRNPIDAIAFALEAQVNLYKSSSWPKGISKQDDAKDEPALKHKGLRVRIGMHHGFVDTQTDESRRAVYIGETVEIAEAVVSICHGGQILTTSETWNTASGMRVSLGRPQALDCGHHLLIEASTGSPGKVCKGLIQLVPHELAFDFKAARGRTNSTGSSGVTIKNASSVFGRLFPPLSSLKQLTTSFLNAPYANGKVTMCIVQTVGLNESDPKLRGYNLKVLAKHVKKQLLSMIPPGYECRAENGQWMLAFDRMANGVLFGLKLKSALHEVPGLRGDVDKECMFKVGVITGAFHSMSPNAVTGKAEYFGPINDRAVSVVNNCEPGQICVGMELKDGDTADPPDFGTTVKVKLLEMKKLPNMKNPIAVFLCTKRNIDMPYA